LNLQLAVRKGVAMKFAGQEAWMYYGKIGKICDKNETSIEYQ